jgi:hypothetical protein
MQNIKEEINMKLRELLDTMHDGGLSIELHIENGKEEPERRFFLSDNIPDFYLNTEVTQWTQHHGFLFITVEIPPKSLTLRDIVALVADEYCPAVLYFYDCSTLEEVDHLREQFNKMCDIPEKYLRLPVANKCLSTINSTRGKPKIKVCIYISILYDGTPNISDD